LLSKKELKYTVKSISNIYRAFEGNFAHYDQGDYMKTLARTFFIFCIFVCLYGGVVFAQQDKQPRLPTREEAEAPLIRLITPMENTEVIGRNNDRKHEYRFYHHHRSCRIARY
jgi:cbb3-type cytochrome oxidase subunit 3